MINKQLISIFGHFYLGRDRSPYSQVNIDDEVTKSGFKIKELSDTVEQVIELPQLVLRGLMAIPASKTAEIDQRRSFSRLRHAQAEINNRLDSGRCIFWSNKG